MSDEEQRKERLKKLLDDQNEWPAEYMFKFIVPQEKENEVKNIFPYENVRLNFSKRGKYVSITVTLLMESAEAVLHVYEVAAKIDGLIAL